VFITGCTGQLSVCGVANTCLQKVVWLAAVAISFQVSGQVRMPESDASVPHVLRSAIEWYAVVGLYATSGDLA
jgi:hypothetical protein